MTSIDAIALKLELAEAEAILALARQLNAEDEHPWTRLMVGRARDRVALLKLELEGAGS
jgi:hypothetical protein